MSVYGYSRAYENDHHLRSTSDKLWLSIGLTTMALGTIGHLLSLFVLIGNRRMRLLSLSVYVIASSLAGLCALYVGLLRQILMTIDDYGDIRSRLSDAGCRLHAAFTYFSLQLFAWLQASMAIERVIAVWRPMHYKRWCTRRRSAIAVVVIATVLAPCNTFVVVSFRNDEIIGCQASDDEHYVYLFDTVWGWLDLVLYSLLPAAIVIPCNCATIFPMMRGGELLRRSANVSCSIRKSRQFTIMLLVHNVVFIVTTLPVSIVFILPRDESEDDADDRAYAVAHTITNLLQYGGTTLGFVVYSTVAEKFRKAFIELLRKGLHVRSSSERASASTRTSRQSETDNAIRLRTLNASTGMCSTERSIGGATHS